MTVSHNTDSLSDLVNELRKLPNETEWLEFKHNNANPDEIGEYISALANSAALCGRNAAYIIWGIDNNSHDIIGTSFSPLSKKIGNEELENCLIRLLKPRIDFHFFEIIVESLLDYPTYFELIDFPLPETRQYILEKLELDKMITRSSDGKWNILKLGAILFARNLGVFISLKRKAVRVFQYKNNSRIETMREQFATRYTTRITTPIR